MLGITGIYCHKTKSCMIPTIDLKSLLANILFRKDGTILSLSSSVCELNFMITLFNVKSRAQPSDCLHHLSWPPQVIHR